MNKSEIFKTRARKLDTSPRRIRHDEVKKFYLECILVRQELVNLLEQSSDVLRGIDRTLERYREFITFTELI